MQCPDYNCDWIQFVTEQPYAMYDAKRLLERIKARLINPTAYPDHFTPQGAVLRLAPPTLPPVSALEGNIKCRAPQACSRRGSKTCIDQMCSQCCLRKSIQFTDGSKGIRLKCPAHARNGSVGYEGEPLDTTGVAPVPTTGGGHASQPSSSQ